MKAMFLVDGAYKPEHNKGQIHYNRERAQYANAMRFLEFYINITQVKVIQFQPELSCNLIYLLSIIHMQ